MHHSTAQHSTAQHSTAQHSTRGLTQRPRVRSWHAHVLRYYLTKPIIVHSKAQHTSTCACLTSRFVLCFAVLESEHCHVCRRKEEKVSHQNTHTHTHTLSSRLAWPVQAWMGSGALCAHEPGATSQLCACVCVCVIDWLTE
jgi:hypothetical protein